MNITLKQPQLIGSRTYKKGETVNVPDARGRRLIASGMGELATPNPKDETVEQLKSKLNALSDPEALQRLRDDEEKGDNRKSALEAIDARIAEVVAEGNTSAEHADRKPHGKEKRSK